MIDPNYLQDIVSELNSAPYKQKGAIVERVSNFLNMSKKTIYAELKKAGYESGRKRRSDMGKSTVSDESIRNMAAMMRASDRANNKKLMNAKVAVEIATENGFSEQELHESTVNKRMKALGVHPKQMRKAKPHVRLKTNHPNHMWQVDPSFCVLYYLRDGKSMAVMDEKKFYKNKPENFGKIAKDRVLRYVCTDHTSGAFFCYYYNTPGETADVMFDFLMRAMGSKDKQKNPFEGVPKMLYWDKGAANKSEMIQNLLNALGINHSAHVPGNSRAKGQVEKTNDIVECNFESRLAFHHITSIDMLNEYCEAWQRHFQTHSKYAHSRHKMPRFTAWRMIKEDELVFRPPYEVCQSLLSTKPQSRVVRGDYQISYEGNQYSLSEVDNIIVGEKIMVTVNPFNYPNIWVTQPNRFGVETRYEIEPLTVDEFGFTSDSVLIDGHHQQAKETLIDKNRKDLDYRAYGTRDEQEIDKLRNQKSQPAFGGKVDALSYLKNLDEANDTKRVPKRGKPLEIEGIQTIEREEVALPVINFIRWFAANHQITPELNKHIRAKYPDGVKESEYEEIAERLVSRPVMKVVNN